MQNAGNVDDINNVGSSFIKAVLPRTCLKMDTCIVVKHAEFGLKKLLSLKRSGKIAFIFGLFVVFFARYNTPTKVRNSCFDA